MKDRLGPSLASGMLIRQSDYFSIKFQKTYKKMAKAGQTGRHDILIYEGKQEG